ncbi:hypothetical protein TUM4644_35620 [Shewanella colwelliana]|uniref:hypothetical protein n=1 Tax=Shewanella colwelliana TaxID=23 RepID=UPI001BB814AE|nr:hypothetical protein [Shewanella colwelliana]GIU34396.1 hypothetical protein TUM4644_35620 [Shewanella colwelliana]
MLISRIIILALTIFSLQACNAMKGQSDMENIVRLMETNSPAKYEAVMHSFVKSAKSSDIDKMIALTSEVTIKQMGIDALKRHYQKDTIPALKACVKISEGGDIVYIDESQAKIGSGWVYHKTCTYGENETVGIRFVILKENGRIALTSFGLG